MVPPASHGIPRVPRYSGSCSVCSLFRYGALTLSGRPSHAVLLNSHNPKCSPQPQRYFYPWFGLFRFRSPLLSESRLISLPPPTEMFQFSGFPPLPYLIQATVHDHESCGFPHSDIPGSRLVCSSPRLIAAYHVLLRLLVPRHSPCALLCLTFYVSQICYSCSHN